MSNSNQFMGLSANFVWGVGIVESRDDPLKLGRCRVRVIGLHTFDKEKIKPEHLPWAMPLSPITSAGVSGVGATALGPVEDTFVLIFFQDAENMQMPIMLGVLQGMPQAKVRRPENADKLTNKTIPSASGIKSVLNTEIGASVKNDEEAMAISKASAGKELSRKEADTVASRLVAKDVPVQDETTAILEQVYSQDPTFDTTDLTEFDIKKEQLVQVLTDSKGFLPPGGDPQQYPVVQDMMRTMEKIKRIAEQTKDIQAQTEVNQILKVLNGINQVHQLPSILGIPSVDSVTGIIAKIEVLRNIKDFDHIQTILNGMGNVPLLRDFGKISVFLNEVKSIKNIFEMDKMTGIHQIRDMFIKVQSVLNIKNLQEYGSQIFGIFKNFNINEALQVVTSAFGINTSGEQVQKIISAVKKLTVKNVLDSAKDLFPDITSFPQFPSLPQKIIQKADGTGVEFVEETVKDYFPRDSYLKEPDTNRLARGENIAQTVVQEKIDNIKKGQENIPTARAFKQGSETTPSKPYTEPKTEYNAVYPYNKVDETESGHIFEKDDTPGFERLHEYHRSGTFREVHPDGSRVEKVVNDRWDVTLRNKFEHVEGTKTLTVDKGSRVLINKDGESGGNLDIEVGKGGDLNVTVRKGDVNINVLKGDADIFVNGDVRENITGDKEVMIGGDLKESIGGDHKTTIGGEKQVVIGGNEMRNVAGMSITVIQGFETRICATIYTHQAAIVSLNPAG